MKNAFKILLVTQLLGCGDKTGVALRVERVNAIPAAPHMNYQLNEGEGSRDRLPKSIIFIIADGAGIGHYSLSYYANGAFAPARFEHVGLVATHPDGRGCGSTCKRVSDSASSGTALSAGRKTYNGAIGVDQDTVAVKTMLEMAEEYGMATGLVATSSITHATPASFAAHVYSRQEQEEIARQYAKQEIDVLLGGGRRFWSDALISEYERGGAQYIDAMNVSLDASRRLLGLFAEDGLPEASEGRTPTTTDMARLAISRLEADPEGYFVMIEESQVDWGGHSNDAEYIKAEMASLNELVDFTLDYQAEHPDVLVILTADHECGGVAVHK